MKSKLRLFFSLFFIFCTVIAITSCKENDTPTNNNIKPPNLTDDINAPVVISFVDYISWHRVSNATEYQVYRNGVLVECVTEEKYDISDFSNDNSYYVVAYNSSTKKKSIQSNTVIISKHTDFKNEEILDLSNEISFSGTIASNIRKIIITKELQSNFNFNCVIAERTNDLILEIKNVNLIGSKNCITTIDGSCSTLKHNYNLILNVTGNCSILGGDGYEFTGTFEDDTEQDGIDGFDGETAIIASSIIVRGDGNLTVSGGNGGDGSRGSSTTAYSQKTIGKGSDGGNGGNGVECQYFVVNMHEASTVKILAGSGGNKGFPGNNTSIITGPLVSAMWDDIYDIGKKGNNGVALKGIAITINGKLHY